MVVGTFFFFVIYFLNGVESFPKQILNINNDSQQITQNNNTIIEKQELKNIYPKWEMLNKGVQQESKLKNKNNVLLNRKYRDLSNILSTTIPTVPTSKTKQIPTTNSPTVTSNVTHPRIKTTTYKMKDTNKLWNSIYSRSNHRSEESRSKTGSRFDTMESESQTGSSWPIWSQSPTGTAWPVWSQSPTGTAWPIWSQSPTATDWPVGSDTPSSSKTTESSYSTGGTGTEWPFVVSTDHQVTDQTGTDSTGQPTVTEWPAGITSRGFYTATPQTAEWTAPTEIYQMR